jgi:hypothetical protein
MTREEALAELKKPIYDPELLKRDKEFVLKKLGVSEEEFDRLIAAPVRTHRDFSSDELKFRILNSLSQAKACLRRHGLVR